MVTWVNIPASLSLVSEFNEAFPNRDKASDGTIGDLAHQGGASDHNPDETHNTGGMEDEDGLNEVHARDVDKDLKREGWTMERCVQLILARCRSGVEKRLRYIIFNRRIWSASSGWTQKSYTGSNPHDKHAHFSFRYGAGGGTSNPENIVSEWGILAAIRAEQPKEPRKVKIQYFNAHLPVIPYGHSDAQGIIGPEGQKDTSTYVKRAQRMLLVEADGEYGPKTRDAIKALGIPYRDGSVIDLEVWERLYAMWGSVLTDTINSGDRK